MFPLEHYHHNARNDSIRLYYHSRAITINSTRLNRETMPHEAPAEGYRTVRPLPSSSSLLSPARTLPLKKRCTSPLASRIHGSGLPEDGQENLHRVTTLITPFLTLVTALPCSVAKSTLLPKKSFFSVHSFPNPLASRTKARSHVGYSTRISGTEYCHSPPITTCFLYFYSSISKACSPPTTGYALVIHIDNRVPNARLAYSSLRLRFTNRRNGLSKR